ncbi:HEAT repeat domain-containing protein [Chloracidobacterium thermophilum]|jgi:HEAT repeat protein|uniref:HEAT repeat protein n=1 Tax=Chloracidobacterium thermophilum (strain B) TaxID=981222 RepID=G2LL98_CHLTF|nr:HEAT repeat domain-containing protein [Chloracidobacterium thermophilum]AEP13373.1 HEAT repeat protein [Chloracidobacterium thermophilum B]QUV80651.1 HEAT repeat domain-containing protein [Chloracidobacterium thermophilum]
MKGLPVLWVLFASFCTAAAIVLTIRWLYRRAAQPRRRPLREILANLEHARPTRRVRAAGELSERTGAEAREAVDALLRRLSDPEPEVRAVVVDTLGKLEDPRASEPLRERLHDDSTEVRGLTVSALVSLRDFAALPEIIRLLDDEDWTIRAWTASEMVRLGREEALETLLAARNREVWRAHLRLCDSAPRVVDERAVSPLLIEMRKAKEMGIRVEAMLALASFGYIPDEEARLVENLVASTEEEHPNLRFQAIAMLGTMEMRRIEPYQQAQRILERLAVRDENALVRAAARHSLKNFTIVRERTIRSLPPPEAMPAVSPVRVEMQSLDMLTSNLKNTALPMRWRYVHALAATRHPKAVVPLIEATHDKEWRVRAAAARGLGLLVGVGETDVRPTLERAAIEDEHFSVRETAELALARITPTSTPRSR